MPATDIGTRLRRLREEHVGSRKDLARLFHTVSDEALPSVESLAHMIKEWERGDHEPSARYWRLYTAVVQTDDGDPFTTGWPADDDLSPDDADRLSYALAHPGRIDASAVESLGVMLAAQRRLEDAIGSVPVLHTVRAQMPVVRRLVAEARGGVRPAMVGTAAQWAQFGGWLSIAAGDLPAARACLDQAAENAEEIGDGDMVGTVLSWKAYLAERLGQHGRMIGLAHAAQRDRRGPGQAYDVFMEARGHARVGEISDAERLLGEAQQVAADADPADARPWEYYYTEPGFWELETGLTHLHIGQTAPAHNGRAVEMLTAGLRALPPGMRRSDWAGVFVVRLAAAQLQAGDAEAACAAAADAAGIARTTYSTSLMRRVRAVHGQMQRTWPDHAGVAELCEAVR